MFKRKSDVDKHVSSILSRKKSEKERSAQGFQIARLYMDIMEYTTARRYLSGYMQGREKASPQAHQLMGDIMEALDDKESAVESYKKALDLGGFGSVNRQLILKICELYCDIGSDTQRMKYWLDKCEEFYPKNEIVFNLKSKIAASKPGGDGTEIESLITAELIERPTDLNLRIKLLNLYEEGRRYEEAYGTAISTDLTIAFVTNLHWYEVLVSVFQGYSKQVVDAAYDSTFLLHYLHVLRNVAFLRLSCRGVEICSQALERFDKQLQIALSIQNEEESWVAFLKEMKGQVYYLAGLMLMKRAHCGALSWQEGNMLSGPCFLASRNVDPLDAQSPWFLKAPQNYGKFYNWWYQQSYDRLSQVGHILQQLSQNDIVVWSKNIKQQAMTASGHQKIFKALYSLEDSDAKDQDFFLYSASDLVEESESREPLSARQLIDIDRVASQVHIDRLSNLVWLCLQRYTPDMTAQPNYHFSLMENIQFSIRNLDSGSGESLCQLDVIVFLLAAVRCAATSVYENIHHPDAHSGRPKLLPMVLCKPLCGMEQEEWWATAYKFSSNNVKTDFTRLRRVLTRGIETVRLIGSHGLSVSMIAHIARSLDAKIQSLKNSEFGCRCPVYELSALEARGSFYWDKAKRAIELIERNQNIPLPKNRLFKEVDDLHLPPSLLENYKADAIFALALSAMKSAQFEAAIDGFSKHRSPWAKFHIAQIYKLLGEKESQNEDTGNRRSEALFIKARDNLYDVKDRLAGDTTHELNIQVDMELEDIDSRINNLDWDARQSTSMTAFSTPKKENLAHHCSSTITSNYQYSNGYSNSTPQTVSGFSSPRLPTHSTSSKVTTATDHSECDNELNGSPSKEILTSPMRPRPSPERLDSQIKSLNHSQASLFKMVLDRNEELILINGKMMEELRDNNTQLKTVLSENRLLMEEIKNFLSENKDTMKQIKNEFSNFRNNPPAPAPINPPQMAPGPMPQMFMPHPAQMAQTQRPAYPGLPATPQGPLVHPPYGYMINTPMPQIGHPQYSRPSGLPGSQPPTVGRFKVGGMEDEEEEEELVGPDDSTALFAEYYDPDYSQYYTPEAHIMQDWSTNSRPTVEAPPSIPIPPPPSGPRMAMPPPGYFASAVRGQCLQYGQNNTATPTKPTSYRPGFFTSPLSPAVTQVSAVNVNSPVVSQSTTVATILSTGSPVQKPDAGVSKSEMNGNSNTSLNAPSEASKAGVFSLGSTSPASSTISFIQANSNNKDSGGKPTVFGGFTFSSTPKVSADGDRERHKVESIKSSTSTTNDTPKPFSGFSLTTPSSTPKSDVKLTTSPVTKSFMPTPRSPGGGDDDVVEEYEPNVDFKPLIALPDLVEKTTGEENEDEVHSDRCRMFRFDTELQAWKERGIGEFKILKSKGALKFRIVMRRDQILKLCANHALTVDMKLTPMANSDRAWCYMAHDFSDEEVKLEKLAVKFKNAEKALEFKNKFEGCVGQLKDAPKDKTTVSPTAEPAAKPDTTTNNSKSLADLFKPKVGSWECDGCYVRNDGEVLKCPACNTLKPGVKPEDLPKDTPAKSGFGIGSLTSGTPATGFKFGSAGAATAPSSTTGFTFGKPVVGESVPSTGGFTFGKSVSATTTKPDSVVTTTKPASVVTTKPASVVTTASPFSFPPSTTKQTTNLSELFKPAAGSWECTGCYVRNNGDVLKCPACCTLKPGTKPEDLPKAQPSSSTVSFNQGPPGTGFTFGGTAQATGDFTFGAPAASSKSDTEVPKFSFGKAVATTAPVSFTSSPATSTPASKPFASPSPFSAATGQKGNFVFGGPAAVVSTTSSGEPFSFAPKTESTKPVFSFSTTKEQTKPKESQSAGLLAKLLTSDNPVVTDEVINESTKPAADSSSNGFNFSMTPKSTTFGVKPSVFGVNSAASPGQSKGFQFSLAKSPNKTNAVPSSPDIDETGMYINKDGDDSHIHFEPIVALPDKIEVKTGEEDEKILFESRAKMYRWVSVEWKEKGVGVVKILEHNLTKKCRLLMRRDQVLKLCCNHVIDRSLKLEPMAKTNGKAWTWFATDFSEDSEGKVEQMALRFGNAEIASEFKSTFDKAKDNASPKKEVPASDVKVPSSPVVKKELFAADSTTTEDDDVIFVREEKPTAEQLARAQLYKLPDCFYLYESKPPCPGCLGCTDGEVPLSSPIKLKTPEKSDDTKTSAVTPIFGQTKDSIFSKATTPAFGQSTPQFGGQSNTPIPLFGNKSSTLSTHGQSSAPLFGSGANLPNFASLTSDSDTDKSEPQPVLFGTKSNVDFSSLAFKGETTNIFAAKPTDVSNPFKFAGAGQQLFGRGASGAGEEADDSEAGVVASDDIHFEPIIPLPDLVEVKTGEEDWSALFTQRAKLYKYEDNTNQWKERGIGEMKIMSHKTQNKFRILQRREQVLKIACNHLISEDMELKPLASSETSWCWTANDFTETEPKIEQFAVKFKNKDIAQEFKKVFEECQEKFKATVSGASAAHAPNQDNYDYDENDEDEEDKVLFEKRVTLSSFEDNQWKKLGLGTLFIKYNDDLNGNSVTFMTDDGEKRCSHVICREHFITHDPSKRICEWKPLDYATDEGVRKFFSASFSSTAAAAEFAKIFNEGQRLAVDSELSENIGKEIDVPEIFSHGEPQK